VSQENVEVVRRAFEAYASGGIDALLPYAAPDCVFYPDPGWIEEAEYRGRDAIAAFNKTQVDAFGDLRIEICAIRAVDEHVLVLLEMVGQAAGSGVPIRQQAAHVLSGFREGTIGEDRTFLSWEAGLEAVGLEE
jgi:ketosteroid isomerase-like protein